MGLREARGRAIGAAALLMIAGCRSDGVRGHERPAEAIEAPQSLRTFRGEQQETPPRVSSRADRMSTAALAALAGSMIEARLTEGRMVLARSPAAPLRAYAAEVIAEAEAQLAALRTLGAALQLDLGATRDDPMLQDQREAAQRDQAMLRGLSDADLARVWLASEPQGLALLGSIAALGTRASHSVAAGNVFRMIAYDARARAARAAALMTRAEDR